MKSLFSLVIFIFAISAHAVQTKNCDGCSDLEKIEKSIAAAPKSDFMKLNDLQLKATDVIDKMVSKNKNLNQNQIAAISRIARLTIPGSPDYAFFDNNLEVFKANRAKFEKAFDSFPKDEAAYLKEKLKFVLESKNAAQDS